jgi:choline monooxygenase
VARLHQLRAPGDYVATEIAGWPIVVVVDTAGALRAWHNVCRHRAGPLVGDGEGSCGSTFVCRYHGWAYELDGPLRRARDFGDDDLDPLEWGLLPLAVDCWRGLVFVNIDIDAEPLAGALGPMVDECVAFPMEDLPFCLEVSHDVDANWKTYADNYLEGYHLPLVHPRLTREVDTARYRVVVGDRFCRHEAPPRDGSKSSGTWLWRYPNLALNLYPDGMNVERFLPLGPDRTRVTYWFFFRSGLDEDTVRFSCDVLEEDRRICEAVQRNLAAGAYSAGRFSPRHENGVHAFQTLVRAALAG